MKIQRTTIYVIAGAAAAIILPLIVYMLLHFKPPLTATEKTVLTFTPPVPGLTPRVWKSASSSCPVNPAANRSIKLKPADAESKTAQTAIIPPRMEEDLRVSFILHGTGKNMAIINGNVLKEGNTFNGWRVIRIEQNRLLIAGKKGKKWLTLN